MNVKQKKQEEIQFLAQTKLESIQDIISKSLTDGRVSNLKFEQILTELERGTKRLSKSSAIKLRRRPMYLQTIKGKQF